MYHKSSEVDQFFPKVTRDTSGPMYQYPEHDPYGANPSSYYVPPGMQAPTRFPLTGDRHLRS